MEKIQKLTAIILVIATLFCLAVPVSAAENEDYGIMPIFENCDMSTASFDIFDDVATVAVEYMGIQSRFSRVEISVKIEKRFLGIFWNDVDIGYPDSTWTASSTVYADIIIGTFPITEAGVYKATFDIYYYGVDGSVDHVEDILTYDYNG